jgi:hypothetical protein
MANDPKSRDPEPAPRPTRAQKLREDIKEIVNRGKKRGAADAANPPEDSAQPRSLHEIFEDRMRDHIGEKKS